MDFKLIVIAVLMFAAFMFGEKPTNTRYFVMTAAVAALLMWNEPIPATWVPDMIDSPGIREVTFGLVGGSLSLLVLRTINRFTRQ